MDETSFSNSPNNNRQIVKTIIGKPPSEIQSSPRYKSFVSSGETFPTEEWSRLDTSNIDQSHSESVEATANIFPYPQPRVFSWWSEFPSDSVRKYCPSAEDNLLSKTSFEFQLFTRAFTDDLLSRIPNYKRDNTSLENIQLIREAWKKISETKRQQWMALANKITAQGHIKKLLPEHFLSAEGCMDPTLSDDQLAARRWASSIGYRKLPCPICPRNEEHRFTNLSDLTAHIVNTHPAVHIYACGDCNKAFISRMDLKKHSGTCAPLRNHLREHKGELKLKIAYISVVCDECGLQIFFSRLCPPNHFDEAFINCMLTHSNENFTILIVYSTKPSECPICKLDIDGSLEEIEHHCFQQHFDQAKHSCPAENCSQRFYTTNAFKVHLMQHLDSSLPFVCRFLDLALRMPPPKGIPFYRVGGRHRLNSIAQNSSLNASFETETNRKMSNVSLKSDSMDISNNSGTVKMDIENEQMAAPNENNSNLEQQQAQDLSLNEWVSEWNEQLESCRANPQSAQKYLINFELNCVYDGNIVKNQGLLLLDDVFLCEKCCAIMLGESAALEHSSKCPSSINNEKRLKKRVDKGNNFNGIHRIFASENFPFERVHCSLCPSTHCSLVALQRHFASDHYLLAGFENNYLSNTQHASAVQTCAQSIKRGEWLKTPFDNYLLELLANTNNNHHSKSKSALVSTKKKARKSFTPAVKTPETSLKDNKKTKKRSDKIVNKSPLKEIKKELVDAMVGDETTSSLGEAGKTPENTDRQKKSSQQQTSQNSAESLSKGSTTGKGKVLNYECYLCTLEFDSLEELKQHFIEHPERWHHCPLCSLRKSEDNETNTDKKVDNDGENPIKFTHIAQLYKHLEAKHIKVEGEKISCPFCPFEVDLKKGNGNGKNTGTLSKSAIAKKVKTMVRHVIYECTGTGLCLLCEESFPFGDNRQKAEEKLRIHRANNHRLIYDRVICTSCLSGFYSQEGFQRHTCEIAYRCRCNPSYKFPSKRAFESHVQGLADYWNSHRQMKSVPMLDHSQRDYVFNDQYQAETAPTGNEMMSGGRGSERLCRRRSDATTVAITETNSTPAEGVADESPSPSATTTRSTSVVSSNPLNVVPSSVVVVLEEVNNKGSVSISETPSKRMSESANKQGQKRTRLPSKVTPKKRPMLPTQLSKEPKERKIANTKKDTPTETYGVFIDEDDDEFEMAQSGGPEGEGTSGIREKSPPLTTVVLERKRRPRQMSRLSTGRY